MVVSRMMLGAGLVSDGVEHHHSEARPPTAAGGGPLDHPDEYVRSVGRPHGVAHHGGQNSAAGEKPVGARFSIGVFLIPVRYIITFPPANDGATTALQGGARMGS